MTGLGTANGAFLLGQFLGERKKDIQLTPTEQLSMPEIAMGNVVFLGASAGSRQIRAVPEDRQLVLVARRNSKPEPASRRAGASGGPESGGSAGHRGELCVGQPLPRIERQWRTSVFFGQ